MATSIAPWSAPERLPESAESVLHDIRGCLTIIRGQCHGVVRDGHAHETIIERLRLIDHEVGRIAAAVDQVRDVMYCAQARTPDWTSVDMGALVRDAVRRVGGVAQARQVTVRSVAVADRVLISGHAPQLDRALDNVLLNAIVASGHGGSVGVAVDAAPGTVSVCVTNDVRPDGPQQSGWGLGLQIVRDIVRRHHGDLVFAANDGHATLWLTFPWTDQVQPQ